MVLRNLVFKPEISLLTEGMYFPWNMLTTMMRQQIQNFTIMHTNGMHGVEQLWKRATARSSPESYIYYIQLHFLQWSHTYMFLGFKLHTYVWECMCGSVCRLYMYVQHVPITHWHLNPLIISNHWCNSGMR